MFGRAEGGYRIPEVGIYQRPYSYYGGRIVLKGERKSEVGGASLLHNILLLILNFKKNPGSGRAHSPPWFAPMGEGGEPEVRGKYRKNKLVPGNRPQNPGTGGGGA